MSFNLTKAEKLTRVSDAVVAGTTDDGSTDAFADLKGTKITVADDDDNGLIMIEVDEPLERYVRCVVDRGTQNAVIDGIVALQYNASNEPVTHDTDTVVGSEYHHAPVEGTA